MARSVISVAVYIACVLIKAGELITLTIRRSLAERKLFLVLIGVASSFIVELGHLIEEVSQGNNFVVLHLGPAVVDNLLKKCHDFTERNLVIRLRTLLHLRLSAELGVDNFPLQDSRQLLTDDSLDVDRHRHLFGSKYSARELVGKFCMIYANCAPVW